MSCTDPVPASILIVGSGAFGLSTAYALSQDSDYAKCEILLLDKWPFESSQPGATVPNPTASSTDTSRLVRSDYDKGPYADLAVQAQEGWRGEWGADGRYSQSGFVVVARDGDTDRLSSGGFNHVTLSYENAMRVVSDKSQIQILESEREIAEASGYPITAASDATEKNEGAWKGYINRASGWADPAATMQWLRRKVVATKRVKMICGTVETLLYSSPADANSRSSRHRTVRGVRLTSGQEILAKQTILAAGPHSSSLTDLRAACEARAQVACYVKLTSEEISHFPEKGNPCTMDHSTGRYIIGPDHHGYLKIARSLTGYRNPVRVRVASDGRPELRDDENAPQASEVPIAAGEKEIETSVPGVEGVSTIVPPEGEADCRAYLRRLFPPASSLHAIATRPFERTRTCWYTDSRSGHFIVCFHPRYADGSLFLATAGSGHAFKFLPVLGEKIKDILKLGPEDGHKEDSCEKAGPHDEEIRMLRSLWQFPKPKGRYDDGIVWCEDGSRHGKEKLIFEENLKA